MLEYTGAFLQLYREEGWYLERTVHYVARVGLDHVKKQGRSKTPTSRKALWERLQFALDGEPDPWFELDKAAVDTRQFKPLIAAGERADRHERHERLDTRSAASTTSRCSARAAWRAPRGVDVAVFRNADDQVFALLDRCPHKGGPLSPGHRVRHSVACPLHNWTIGLDDGCAQRARRRLHAALRVQGRGRRGAASTRGELATHADRPARRAGRRRRDARRRAGLHGEHAPMTRDALHLPATAASAAA